MRLNIDQITVYQTLFINKTNVNRGSRNGMTCEAFDRVWHKGLLYKLHSVGISGNLLDMFADYLSERKQSVVLPGVSSDWSTLEAGVPQGSILGPLLF